MLEINFRLFVFMCW